MEYCRSRYGTLCRTYIESSKIWKHRFTSCIRVMNSTYDRQEVERPESFKLSLKSTCMFAIFSSFFISSSLSIANELSPNCCEMTTAHLSWQFHYSLRDVPHYGRCVVYHLRCLQSAVLVICLVRIFRLEVDMPEEIVKNQYSSRK